ncbi:hypothetical protein DA798_11830 [Lactobacillus sp. PFC-70]|nr:hypothetical protein DA798_11830 [Lactobacillus sp. PFC-70]
MSKRRRKRKKHWFDTQVGSLVFVNLLGIGAITLFNAYYSFGTMLFKVSLASAATDFFRSEVVFNGLFLIVWNGYVLIRYLVKKYRK